MATRKGILGTKLGMTQIFDEDSRIVPVTVVQAGPCTVTQVRTTERDGYNALQIAYGARRKVNKPTAGHLAPSGLESAKVLAELRTDEVLDVGTAITCDVFTPGQLVDVTGTSKGKGFTGVMRRHGFHGMGDGHGVKKKNRHPGSVGGASTPGRTFKGQRMAGHHGDSKVTIQNLEVVEVDTERNLILLRGAVPGSNGDVILLRAAAKAPANHGSDTQAGEA